MRWRSVSRRAPGVVPLAVGFLGFGLLAWAPASAALCGTDSVRISAKFSEAASLCGSPSPADPPTGDRTPAPAGGFHPDRVSIRFSADSAWAAAPSPPPTGRTGSADGIDSLIARVGETYRVDPYLLTSMVSAESAGRLDAVSPKGALGLMQVMPATARDLDVADPGRLLRDPELALTTGARFLKQLQARFGNDVPVIVAAYNAGPGAVLKAGGIPRYRETRDYVAAVMRRYRQLLRLAR